ncbi:unnamed protein product [Arctogadus glacialis]
MRGGRGLRGAEDTCVERGSHGTPRREERPDPMEDVQALFVQVHSPAWRVANTSFNSRLQLLPVELEQSPRPASGDVLPAGHEEHRLSPPAPVPPPLSSSPDTPAALPPHLPFLPARLSRSLPRGGGGGASPPLRGVAPPTGQSSISVPLTAVTSAAKIRSSPPPRSSYRGPAGSAVESVCPPPGPSLPAPQTVPSLPPPT